MSWLSKAFHNLGSGVKSVTNTVESVGRHLDPTGGKVSDWLGSKAHNLESGFSDVTHSSQFHTAEEVAAAVAAAYLGQEYLVPEIMGADAGAVSAEALAADAAAGSGAAGADFATAAAADAAATGGEAALGSAAADAAATGAAGTATAAGIDTAAAALPEVTVMGTAPAAAAGLDPGLMASLGIAGAGPIVTGSESYNAPGPQFLGASASQTPEGLLPQMTAFGGDQPFGAEALNAAPGFGGGAAFDPTAAIDTAAAGGDPFAPSAEDLAADSSAGATGSESPTAAAAKGKPGFFSQLGSVLKTPKGALEASSLGVGLYGLLNKPPLPGAAKTALNSAGPAVANAQSIIQTGGTGSPLWNNQKATIDAQFDQAIKNASLAIQQAGQNSGMGGSNSAAVQGQIAQMTADMEAKRLAAYDQALQQNVNNAIAELTGANQTLMGIANIQLQEDQYAQNIARSIGDTTGKLASLWPSTPG